MRTHRRWSWLAAVIVVFGACRHGGEELPPVDPNATVLVQVENHYRGDVIVYLVTGGQRLRLGTVTAFSSAEYSFPWRWLRGSGTSRLLARPLAAGSYASDPLSLQPGQSISWTLEDDLERSSLTVY